MTEGAILEPPNSAGADAEVVEQEETQEVPSVFSVTHNHLIGRIAVSPPAEDGSRILQLFSSTGGAIIEANLSQRLCEFASTKLVEVEVIIEDVDGEVVEDAGTTES